MTDIAGVVRDASFEISSTSSILPTPFIAVFSAFNRIHRVWRRYRQAKIYTNPNNFVALAGGHALNGLLGDKLLVRISAISVLIANRILLAVDQVYQLQESYRKLQNSFKDEYSKAIKYKVINNKILSPSTVSELKYNFKRALEKTKRIFLCIFQLLKESFILSMRMMDAIETFYMSPETRNEGINEIFVNGTQLLDKLEENRQALKESIRECKPVIEKVLKGIGSRFTADQFINLSSDAIESISDAHQATKEVTNLVGSIVVEVAKRTLFGLARVLGLHKMLPKKLYPDYSVKPREVLPRFRFAPDDAVQVK